MFFPGNACILNNSANQQKDRPDETVFETDENPCRKHPRQSSVIYSYRTSHKDNLSNILICSILAMTRRKAEGELGNESVDLCTSEQWEG